MQEIIRKILDWSHTIKQNGRLGQPQSGVNIYGKLKDETFIRRYKWKDNYSNAWLTEKEIDLEIKNAKKYQFVLKVFEIVTTAPKDFNIEKYVQLRKCKVETTVASKFFLYSWQDLSDLIEENRDTFNWYFNTV